MYKLFKDDTKPAPKQSLGDIVKINLKSTGEDNVEAKIDKVYSMPKIEGTSLPSNLYQVQQYASGIPKQDKRLNDKTKTLNGVNYTTRKIVPFEPRMEFYKKRPDERSELEEMILKARVHKIEEDIFKKHLMEQNRFNKLHHNIVGKRLKGLEAKLDKEIDRINNLPIPDEQKKSLMDKTSAGIIEEMNRLGVQQEEDPVNKFLEKSSGFSNEDLINAESKLSIYEDNMRSNAELVAKLEGEMDKFYDTARYIAMNERNATQRDAMMEELDRELLRLNRQRELLLTKVQSDEAKRNRLRDTMEMMKTKKSKLVKGETGLSTSLREYNAEERIRELLPAFDIANIVDEDLREKTDAIKEELEAEGGAVSGAGASLEGTLPSASELIRETGFTHEFKQLKLDELLAEFFDQPVIKALSIENQNKTLQKILKDNKTRGILEQIRGELKTKKGGTGRNYVLSLEGKRRAFKELLDREVETLQGAKIPAYEGKEAEAVAEALAEPATPIKPKKPAKVETPRKATLIKEANNTLENKVFNNKKEFVDFLNTNYYGKNQQLEVVNADFLKIDGGKFKVVLREKGGKKITRDLSKNIKLPDF